MEFDAILRGLAILATFVGLYLAAVKVRRDEKINSRKALTDDFVVLEKLNKDNFYYENVRSSIQRNVLRIYPPCRIHHRLFAYLGLAILLLGGTGGVYLFAQDNSWAWLFMFLTIVGLELQRRSQYPGGTETAPAIDIKESVQNFV